jgi:hypothetical protein
VEYLDVDDAYLEREWSAIGRESLRRRTNNVKPRPSACIREALRLSASRREDFDRLAQIASSALIVLNENGLEAARAAFATAVEEARLNDLLGFSRLAEMVRRIATSQYPRNAQFTLSVLQQLPRYMARDS